MIYVIEWEFPVDKLQDAAFAYEGLTADLGSKLDIELYWMADTMEGRYRGIGIARVESDEALYEFFAALEPIASVRFTPAVGGDDVIAMWHKRLAQP